MYILGISAFHHDAAACLLKDGQIVAAAQEERFTRKKFDPSFPINAIQYCLSAAGIKICDVGFIGFYERPFIKLCRGFLKGVRPGEELGVGRMIKERLGYKGRIIFASHHLSHAASSFLVSPFDKAAILVVDGVGETETVAYGTGDGNRIKFFKHVCYPHSLGLFYSAITQYLGFRPNSAEYKVMGLAPYGESVYYNLFMNRLVSVKGDGSFRINTKYFSHKGSSMSGNKALEALFGNPPRKPEEELAPFHQNVAASLQKVTEEIMLKMAGHLYEKTRLQNLCLAGGVALNCVANGRVLRETQFRHIFVQPAAGDAGAAIGVASHIYHTVLGNARHFVMEHAFLGPSYSNDDIRAYLDGNGIEYAEYDRQELIKKAAQLLVDQKVMGWFQGRMEFGPRALGSRSILADPRNPDARQIVNAKIKFREEFRPFAPTVLEERCGEYFESGCPSPFMLLVGQVRPEKRTMPSVTHVDGSARIQTIRREHNSLYYDLIDEFGRLSGCPVVLNTSFNLRGEPLVASPHDAYLCFMRSGLDYLVIGNFILDKTRMKELKETVDWRTLFELD